MANISIVTPSLNQGRFLKAAIDSVLCQDGPGVDYVVMDGGSTDGSVDIIRAHQSALFYWQSRPDAGQSAAINEGFTMTGGDVLGWLNADDRLTPGALQCVASFFEDNPECQWLAGAGQIVTPAGTVVETLSYQGPIVAERLTRWPEFHLSQPSVFWRRELWEKVGGLDESLDFSMDFDLWLRFAQCCPGHSVNEILSRALQHRGMKTMAYAAESFVETCLVLDRHGFRDLARDKLSRATRRAFELDRRLRIITRNPLYRRWRERREGGRRENRH